MLASQAMYEISLRFWQHQDYEKALVAVEQAIALKLFPFQDPQQLLSWQQCLVSQGTAFHGPRMQLAVALALKAQCVYDLGLRKQSVEFLSQGIQAVGLAAELFNMTEVGRTTMSFSITAIAN